jgi:MFS family permease
MAGTQGGGADEWRSGWPVVVASSFGITLWGANYYAAGTFIAPLEQEFGWSRAEISSAFIVYSLVNAALKPPAGFLLDRWGPRRIGIPGAVLVGLVFALFSTLNGSLTYWLTLWLLLAITLNLVTPSVWGLAISRAFQSNRGRALGGMMFGSALAGIFAPLWSNYLIETHGWRTAYIVMGLGWCGIVTLVCLALLREPRERQPAETVTQPAVALTGYSVRDGIRSEGFIKIASSILISNLLNLALMFHLIPLLTSIGVARESAVQITSSLGIWMIPSMMAYGLISDRVPPKVMTAILVAIPAIACVMLLYPDDAPVWQRFLAIGVCGLSFGAQLPSYINLSTRYFGMRNYGTLSALSGIATAIATAIAPFIAGKIYDHTHSYTILLIAGIPLLLTASLILLSLGRIPQFEPVPAPSPEPAGSLDPASSPS